MLSARMGYTIFYNLYGILLTYEIAFPIFCQKIINSIFGTMCQWMFNSKDINLHAL